jgi:hypothetical protein
MIDEKTPTTEAPKAKAELMPIELDERGLVQAKNNSELIRFCNAMIASEMVPKRFDTPQKLFGALMFVRSLNLPDVSIRQVAIVHGTPSLFGDLPLGLAQHSEKFKAIKEVWVDENQEVICLKNKNLKAIPWAAVCTITREGGEPEEFVFTLDDAIQAKLFPDKNADKPWNKYTKIMLRYRARSLALKSQFADCISGVSIAEYDHDVLGQEDMRDVTGSVEVDKPFELGEVKADLARVGEA